jgi:hypothetical protein
MLLPLIEQFFNSDESGAHDPFIQALDQQLDSEIPGYKDHGTPKLVSSFSSCSSRRARLTPTTRASIEGEPTKLEQSEP